MSNRSQHKVRSVLWRACVAALLILIVLPRLTVHSHSTLSCAGVDGAALAQHIQLCHSKAGCEIPFDAPHMHWQLRTDVSTVPSTTLEATAYANAELNSSPDLDCVDLVLPLSNFSEGFSKLLAGNLNPGLEQAGLCQRIRFCVWTC